MRIAKQILATLIIFLCGIAAVWAETNCGSVQWEESDAPFNADGVNVNNSTRGYRSISYKIVEGVFLNEISITFYEDQNALDEFFEKRRVHATWSGYPASKKTDDGVYLNCSRYGQVITDDPDLIVNAIFKKGISAPQCGELGGYWTAYEGYDYANLEAVYKGAYISIAKSMKYCTPPSGETYETNRWCIGDFPSAGDVYEPVKIHFANIKALIDRKCALSRDPEAFYIIPEVILYEGETKELTIDGGAACEGFEVISGNDYRATGAVDIARRKLMVTGHHYGKIDTVLVVTCGGRFPVEVNVKVTTQISMDPHPNRMYVGDAERAYFSGGMGEIRVRSEDSGVVTAELKGDEYGSWVELKAVSKGKTDVTVSDDNQEILMAIEVLDPGDFIAMPNGSLQKTEMVLELADFLGSDLGFLKGTITLKGGKEKYDYDYAGGVVSVEWSDSFYKNKVDIKPVKIGTSIITFSDSTSPQPREDSVVVHVIDHHASRIYDDSILYIPYITLSGKTYQAVFALSDANTPLRFTFVSGKEIGPYKGQYSKSIASIDPAERTVYLPIMYYLEAGIRAKFLIDSLAPFEIVLLSLGGDD